MKLKVKNGSGMEREIPTGLSWTGFIFTGFTMIFRGMTTKGFLFLIAIYAIQGMIMSFVLMVALFGEQGEAGAMTLIWTIILCIPNIVFLYKLNKRNKESKNWFEKKELEFKLAA